jgi:hypothetical protein
VSHTIATPPTAELMSKGGQMQWRGCVRAVDLRVRIAGVRRRSPPAYELQWPCVRNLVAVSANSQHSHASHLTPCTRAESGKASVVWLSPRPMAPNRGTLWR